MTLDEDDLIKVVDELRLKGYSDNFVIKDNLIFSTNINQGFREENVTIEEAYQFDISENAIDSQYLFAVFIPKHELRGLIIDLLGMYFYMEDQPISAILRKAPLITYIFDDDEPYLKYGLKKISPSEFNADSNRYVLRAGFPDFPECPMGIAFSMLGFDEQTQEYIWLSTSILKDNRLKRVEYKNYKKSMKEKNNMIETVKDLNRQGYIEEFRVTDDKLYWLGKGAKYNFKEFQIDYAYRFESADTPEDASLIFGISIPNEKVKGILVDMFDTFSSLKKNALVNKILSVETKILTHEDSNLDLKFGIVPKVHKSKFNEDPHRYILRKDFPDFPACPFGQSFSILGYDKKLEKYVWLATSILRDERLKTVQYGQRLDPNSQVY